MEIFLKVDDNISLISPQPRLAEEIFEIVDAQRAYLREWLPWVDKTRSVSDLKTFLKDSAIFNQGGQRLTTFVLYKQKIVGSVGFVRFDKDNQTGEMGYWLRQELQGRGIMTKACRRLMEYVFRAKAINRIEIKVASDNLKSMAIPHRLGFTHEGTLGEGIFLYGQYHDVELFAFLKKDWQAS